jgi:hypothetical protein
MFQLWDERFCTPSSHGNHGLMRNDRVASLVQLPYSNDFSFQIPPQLGQSLSRRTACRDGLPVVVRPDLVFHGHRNGSITMHDSCTNNRNTHTVVFPVAPSREVDKFGSVARIQLRFDQQPDQLLARGSNTTCCHLLDVRSLGEPSTQHRGRSSLDS